MPKWACHTHIYLSRTKKDVPRKLRHGIFHHSPVLRFDLDRIGQTIIHQLTATLVRPNDSVVNIYSHLSITYIYISIYIYIYIFFWVYVCICTLDGGNPAPVDTEKLPFLQGFKHLRWCRISAINSSTLRIFHQPLFGDLVEQSHLLDSLEFKRVPFPPRKPTAEIHGQFFDPKNQS